MSFGIQTQPTLSMAEIALFTGEADEAFQQETVDSSLPEAQGGLKTRSKHYTFTPRPNAPLAKEAREYVKTYGSAFAKTALAEKPSPMNMASKTLHSSFQSSKGEGKSEASLSQPKISDGKQHVEKATTPRESLAKPVAQKTTTLSSQPIKKESETVRDTPKISSCREKNETSKEKNPGSAPLASRQWSREETKEWWETRYHQRERQGDQKRDDQEQNAEQEEKKFRISKTAGTSSKNSSTVYPQKENGSSKIKKPELPLPQVGVFALYYILTKMGILSDGTSSFAYKKEIEIVDLETTETHKKRLEDVKEAIKKEQESVRWDIAVKVFSWIGSLVGIVAGISLIATGVGAVAGAMLIVGGLIQISNQLMEIAGGWKKVAELLPGEDSEKKRAIMNWMQIGIAVLCLILAGAGTIWGGISQVMESMQTAMGVIGGIASIGYGVTTIGDGISGFMYKDKLGDIRQFDVRLAQLKHMRKDLLEKVELGVDRLEQLFEDLAHALEFDVELFQADQMVNRR